MNQIDSGSRTDGGVVAFADHYGTYIIGIASQIPPRLHPLALHSATEIQAHLAMAQQNRAFMTALRAVVAQAVPTHFTRDSDLLAYVAAASGNAVPRMLVIDLTDRRFVVPSLGGSGAAATASTGMMQGTAGGSVSSMSMLDRTMEVLSRVPKFLPGAAGEEFRKLISKESLAMIAGTLAIWAGAHLVGAGEAIDVVLVAVGFFFLGMQIFDLAKLIAQAIKLILNASSESDLDEAAKLLAKAAIAVGVALFIALLMKLVAKSGRGKAEGPEATPKTPKEPIPIKGEMGSVRGEFDPDMKIYRIEPKDVTTPLEPHSSPYFDGRWDFYAGEGARPGDRVLYFTNEAGAADLLSRKNYFDASTPLEVRTTTLGEMMNKYPDGKVFEDNALGDSWIFWAGRAKK